MSLSVVIPATDDPPTLEWCLAAIAAAEEPPEEVIVVDRPVGSAPAGARNAGARRATGDVLVFVDADVEVRRCAFARIRDAFARDPSLDAVFGSYDDVPSAPGTVAAFRNLLHHHVHHVGAGAAETFWSGVGAVRRNAFLAIGGFDDERYHHPSVEDIELGRRLAGAGASIRLDPRIQGTHLKAWSLRSMIWTDFARRGVPWVALEWRRRRLSSALNLGWRHRVSALASLTLVLAAALVELTAAAGALAVLLWLNRSFYSLLLRRQGAVRALAGLSLHVVHHLVAVAAVPVGIAVAVVRDRDRPRRGDAAPLGVDEPGVEEPGVGAPVAVR